MILYTIGNINLETVKLVAKVVQGEMENTQKNIRKVVIFNTVESHEKQAQQIKIYRHFLGEKLIFQELLLDQNGMLDHITTTDIFNNKEEKIIDITNGQKTTGALLYFVASLLNVRYVFYIKLKANQDNSPNQHLENTNYDYIQIPTFKNISSLARISYFDLIYYIKELNQVFDQKYSGVDHLRNDILTAIIDYHGENSPKNIIISATSCEEFIRRELAGFLQTDSVAVAFSQNNNFDWTRVRDNLGGITRFFSIYSKSFMSDKNLSPLVTSGGILSALRNYRNLAAHFGSNPRIFSKHEARIVINLSMELFRISKLSPAFWDKIK